MLFSCWQLDLRHVQWKHKMSFLFNGQRASAPSCLVPVETGLTVWPVTFWYHCLGRKKAVFKKIYFYFFYFCLKTRRETICSCRQAENSTLRLICMVLILIYVFMSLKEKQQLSNQNSKSIDFLLISWLTHCSSSSVYICCTHHTLTFALKSCRWFSEYWALQKRLNNKNTRAIDLVWDVLASRVASFCTSGLLPVLSLFLDRSGSPVTTIWKQNRNSDLVLVLTQWRSLSTYPTEHSKKGGWDINMIIPHRISGKQRNPNRSWHFMFWLLLPHKLLSESFCWILSTVSQLDSSPSVINEQESFALLSFLLSFC